MTMKAYGEEEDDAMRKKDRKNSERLCRKEEYIKKWIIHLT